MIATGILLDVRKKSCARCGKQHTTRDAAEPGGTLNDRASCSERARRGCV
jgi:hypothetical protein